MSETPANHPAAGIPLPVYPSNPDRDVAYNTVDVGAIPVADPDGAGQDVGTLGGGLDMGQ